MKTSIVYLLHFDQPIARGVRARDGVALTAQHYTGSTSNLTGRLAAHATGHGSNFTRVMRNRGIGFTLAGAWEGDRTTERYTKNRKAATRLCPVCRPPSYASAPERDHLLRLSPEGDNHVERRAPLSTASG